jgi:hypothetical protein
MNELEKIREAEYFLDRMTEERESRDAFRFDLSAFLSASRPYCSTLSKQLASSRVDRHGMRPTWRRARS